MTRCAVLEKTCCALTWALQCLLHYMHGYEVLYGNLLNEEVSCGLPGHVMNYLGHRRRTCLFKDEVLYGNLLIEEVGEGNEQWFMKAFMFKDNVQGRLLKQFAEKLELLVAQLLVFLLSIDRQKGFEGYVKMH
ncbi:hypothetical protein M0R45_020894 [Rubus argutus]|uniref:Uncharacterized protein n=1 Tax=Rubus argutus TaxID=59490 RepID=A0AAW1XBL8_RUBAR